MPIWLIQLVVGVVLNVASTLLQQANTKKPEPSGYRGSAQVGGKVPQSAVLGTIALPGKLVYPGTWGSSGDTPNAHLTKVFSFGVLPITGCTGLYINGQRVTKASTGHVAQGFPIPEFAGKLWWEFVDGRQTSANTFLRSAFGSDADRPFTADMIGRGIPYLTLDALYDPKVFNGEPALMAELQGIPAYDLRKDSTVGGSGTQRLNDQSTWAFSDNVAVLIYNVLIGLRYENTVVWGGRAMPTQLPYATWAAAMNACDAAIPLAAGGTERQFRAGLEVSFDRTPTDVIRDLLVACNGRISEVAGSYYILVGAPGEADGSFTDADIIITEGASLAPFPSLDSIINGATATYLEPLQAWESKETAPYYRSDLELEDDGRRQTQGLDLACVFSGTQAQRILKAVVEEARRFKKHVVVLPPQFAVYRPLQTLAWTSAANGYTAKLWLITARTVAPNGNVILGLQEIDPADYAWSAGSDERPLSFAPLTPIRPPAQVTTGFTAAPYLVSNDVGDPKQVGIEVFWDPHLTDVARVRIQVRQQWDGAVITDVTADYDPDEDLPSRVVANPAIRPESTYEVRGIYLPFSGRITRWSNQAQDGTEGAWKVVITGAVPPVDVADIQVTQLGDELRNAYGLLALDGPGSMADKLNALLEQIARQAAAGLDAQATVQIVTKVLKVQTAKAMAAVITEQTARIDGDSALASQITDVVASLNDVIAGGFLRFDSVVDPGGASATITAKVKASAGAAFSQAAWILKAVANGAGTDAYFGVLGSLYVFNSDNEPVPVITMDSETGAITAGRLRSPDGKFDINLAAGEETITG